MDTHFHFYHSATGKGGAVRAWLLRLAAALALLALGLAAWYSLSPVSFARAWGKVRGAPLAVERLDLEVNGRPLTVSVGAAAEVDPAARLRYLGFASSRWLNYDLEAFSPDFDLALFSQAPRTLVSVLGEDSFTEPRTLSLEIREKGEVRAVFRIRSAFSAEDWARLAEAAGDPGRRIELFRRALALAPEDPSLREKLAGELAGAEGRGAELAALLEGFLSEDPEGPAARGLLARLLGVYRGLGDGAGETGTLERLLALETERGGDTAPYRRALAALYRSPDPSRAADLYEGLLREAAQDERLGLLSALLAIYRETGEAGKAMETFERMLPLASADQAPGIWSELVRLREESGDAAGADRAWEGLARALPDGKRKADAWRHLGALRAGREDLDGAAAALREAVALTPYDPALFRALAAIARRKGDQEGLRENLEKALALGPDPELRRELALVYSAAGMHDRALAAWRELSEAPDGSPAADEAREDARARLLEILRPPGGTVTAEFEEALYRYSRNGVEFYNLGVAHFRSRQWDAAEKAFKRALELDEGGVGQDCRGYLMALYREKKDTPSMLAQAEALYRADPSRREHRDLMAAELEVAGNWEALESAASGWAARNPSDPDNWRYLALAQRNLKRPAADVARSLHGAARAEPGSVTAWLAAADALEKAGDVMAAKTAYEKVLELDEKNEKAGQALLRLTLERLRPPAASGGGAAAAGAASLGASAGEAEDAPRASEASANPAQGARTGNDGDGGVPAAPVTQPDTAQDSQAEAADGAPVATAPQAGTAQGPQAGTSDGAPAGPGPQAGGAQGSRAEATGGSPATSGILPGPAQGAGTSGARSAAGSRPPASADSSGAQAGPPAPQEGAATGGAAQGAKGVVATGPEQ